MAQAYVWFSLAAARGNLDAAGNRDAADRRLTPEQREQARKAVQEWKPKLASK
jgi:TPR repeat protein